MDIISDFFIFFDDGKKVNLDVTDSGFSAQKLHDTDIELWREYRNSRKWDFITWNYGTESFRLNVNGKVTYLCPSVDLTKLIITNLNNSKTCDIYDGTANKLFEFDLPFLKSPNHPCNRALPKASRFMEPVIWGSEKNKVNAVWVSHSEFMLEELHEIDLSTGVITNCIATQRR